jgi:hypothetical protein
MFMCIDAFVTERSDRLRRAFQESRYVSEGLSALETARRIGWNPNSFKSNMNGNSPFSFEQAKKYAEKFRVRAEWLYDGNGPMREVSRPARSADRGSRHRLGQRRRSRRRRPARGSRPPDRRQPAAWRVFRDRDCRRQRRPRCARGCADHRQRRRPHAARTATSTSSVTAESRR